MTNEIAHPCQHGNEAVLCLQCHRDEIERLNGYVEHLVADREKQALAMTGEIERLKAELDQRNAEFREYARKTELEFRRLREALDRIAHPAAEWMNISEAAAIARDALKEPAHEPSVYPNPSEEAAEIARGFAKLREALLEAGWTPPDPDEHPFATEFRRLVRRHHIPRPDLPSGEEVRESSVLHEGVRQSYLKACEISLASGLLGDGDRSDLLELYESLWPRAPSDIRANALKSEVVHYPGCNAELGQPCNCPASRTNSGQLGEE